MKFRDGYWGLKEGARLLSPVEVRDVTKTSDSLTIFASCKRIRHRGDTLNTAMLTTTYSSPLPDVIRVRTWHFKGTLERGPRFELKGDGADSIRFSESTDSVAFAAGKLEVAVRTKGAWSAEYRHDGRRLTGAAGNRAGHFTLPDGSTFMSEQLGLSVGEQVYGLGERFTPFVKNGQVVDMWNEDGGTSSELAYKNVPFYLTNRGYGVLVAHPGRVSFEVASEVVSAVQFSVPGEYLEYYLIAGKEPKEVLRRYAQLSGRPALPPAWSFGLWLSTSFTTEYDEATVHEFVNGMLERRIPLHVFHFDCFWMKEFQWVDLEWDRDAFADPKAIIGRLKEKGLHVCVWINPYVAQKSRLFDEGMANGYLVRRPDGGVWQWDRWQAGMGLVDFTNPDAAAWFTGALGRLLDLGVDAFKTDFGERIPTEVAYHDGSDPVKMHNYFTYLYNKSVFELLESKFGRGKALVFARSATSGGQKFPVHWGGDCSATYESMAESMRGGLSLGLSGFGFWSHDIGGFESTATPDLYKRWIAFGLLSSHSRMHGNEAYKVPWLYDEESSDVLRFFVQLKCRLMPYLYAAAVQAAEEGIPMMRAMLLEFPDDPACGTLDRQYLLGDSLLVAPVFDERGEVTYYVPAGTWTNFLTGERVAGGSWRTERHGYQSLPLLARPNSLIAVGAVDTRPDYDYAQGVCLHLFELDDGCRAAATVVDPEGRTELTAAVQRRGESLVVEKLGAATPWSLLLRGIERVGSVTGGAAAASPEGVQIMVGADTERLHVEL